MLSQIQEGVVDSWHKRGRLPTRSAPLLPLPKGYTDEISSHGDKGGAWTSKLVETKPYKQLSSKEWEEKCNKGLCFVCDEKYSPGHRCKGKQLFKLDVYMEEGAAETEEGQGKSTEPIEDGDLPLLISSNVIASISLLMNYKTIRVSRVANG